MQYTYRNKYLLVILDANVYVYKNEKCKLNPAIFSVQAKIFFLVNQNFAL